MDEATSALDEATETALYQLLRERLPHSAIVSIGHRANLRQLHARRIEIRKTGGSAGTLAWVPQAA
jgi:putative ATP-binding cassette transporter